MSGGAQARALGRWGEELVARHLAARGWRILAANYRCRFGEIDLIVQDGGYLAFVEVKLRKDSRFGLPLEAVTQRKQERLRATAQLYLAEHPNPRQPRFDVAEVLAPRGMATRRPRIQYIEDAF